MTDATKKVLIGQSRAGRQRREPYELREDPKVLESFPARLIENNAYILLASTGWISQLYQCLDSYVC